jgi:endonuclease/exonuclease/phosphatase family metal-dependent hydrolase
LTPAPSSELSDVPILVDQLTAVPAAECERFLGLPHTPTGHAEAYAAVPAFGQVELRQANNRPAVDDERVRIASWNLERCLYPQQSARLLQRSGADIALLTEMDIGMLRTGQVHTTGEVAEQLGHGYCYGLEFLELNQMEPPGGHARNGDTNRVGFHGNAITAAAPIRNPVVIGLDEVADWFAPAAQQRRVGRRMALAATFEFAAVRFVACTVHLENRTDGAGRAGQMRTLLDALDGYADGLPVVIGGDLNTDVAPGDYTDAAEPLFAAATERGYDWARSNLALPTTRASAWSPGDGTRQLDWFCVRGADVDDPAVVPALGDDGTVFSDHEMVLLSLCL